MRLLLLALRIARGAQKLRAPALRDAQAIAEHLESLALQQFYLGRLGDFVDALSLSTKIRCKLQELSGLRCVFVLPDSSFQTNGGISFVEMYLKGSILAGRPDYYFGLSDPEKFAQPFLVDLLASASHGRIIIVKSKRVRLLLRRLLRALAFPLDGVLAFRGRTSYVSDAFVQIQRQWDDESRGPLLDRDAVLRRYAGSHLARLGVGQRFNHVCLHVREAGYRNDATTDSNRNADVKTYLPVIREIERQGLRVVRMGDPSMSALPEATEVLDYAHSDQRSPFMDALLVASCRFYVGTNSGPHRIAVMFGIPTLCTNSHPAIWFYFRRNDVYLPKYVFSDAANRELSFSELTSDRVASITTDAAFAASRLRPVDNTPDQLLEAVREISEAAASGAVPSRTARYGETIARDLNAAGYLSSAFFDRLDVVSPPRLDELRLDQVSAPALLTEDMEAARASAEAFLGAPPSTS